MASSQSFRSVGSEVKPPFTLTSAELRKINKPIVEKRRRERINGCLDELKTLLLQHSPAENSGQESNQSVQSKLEKADILEMAVRYLRTLHRQNSASDVIASYRDGFADCAKEVATYFRQTEEMSSTDSSKMLCHLATRLNEVNSISSCSKLHKFVASSTSTGAQPMSSAGQETPLDNNNPVNRLAKHRRRLFQHHPYSSKRIRCGEPHESSDSRQTRRTSCTIISERSIISECSGVELTKACEYSSVGNIPSVTVDNGRSVRDQSNKAAFSELDINGNKKDAHGNQITQTPHDGNSSAVWRPW